MEKQILCFDQTPFRAVEGVFKWAKVIGLEAVLH